MPGNKKTIIIGAAVLVVILTILSNCGSDGPVATAPASTSQSAPKTEAEQVTSMTNMQAAGVPEIVAKAGQGDPWANANIEGNITSDMKFREQDDFYAAVNKEWLTSNHTDEDTAKTNMIQVISGKVQEDDNKSDFGNEYLWEGHTRDYWTIQEAYRILTNWEVRNKNGVVPAVNVVSDINTIDSMDALKKYLFNPERNLNGVQLLSFTYAPDKYEPSNVILKIDGPKLMMGDAEIYQDPNNHTKEYEKTHKKVLYLLQRIGYSSDQAEKIWRQGYRYEVSLASRMYTNAQIVDPTMQNKVYFYKSYSDLRRECGDYNFADVMDAYGIRYQGKVLLTCQDLFKDLQTLYTENYLENIKSWMICRNVLDMRYLLDKQALQTCYNIEHGLEETNGTFPSDDELIYDTLNELMPEVLDNEYARNFGKNAQKKDMLEAAVQITDTLHTMMDNTYWLSKESKEMVLKKLNGMSLHIDFPDDLPDLSLCEQKNTITDSGILSVYSLGNRQRMSAIKSMTSRTYTTPVWDPSVSVRGSECQYIPDSNSLYLPAALFNKEETYEEMLGTDGFLIANSIAHSIFGTGAYYNEFGEYKHWWSEDDQSEYLARMSPLTEKLNNITYMENAKYNGVLVREEAAIDLASMQTLHKIAENKGKFDYKTFYESFTKMLKMEKSVKEIRAWALDNEVPLPYIRVNLTLSQFDEFAETYRVHPNDRMHVDEAAKLFILE